MVTPVGHLEKQVVKSHDSEQSVLRKGLALFIWSLDLVLTNACPFIFKCGFVRAPCFISGCIKWV